jgi:multisubunit Na+/H+ antiporter MnhB subunit
LTIGVELVLEQVWNIVLPDLVRFAISVSIILLSLAYAHFKPIQKLRFILVWLSQGIGIVNELVDWVLAPLRGLFTLIGIALRTLRKIDISR